jgi:hypothetical protein
LKRLINRYWLQQENEKMNNELDVIKTLEELEQFLISVEAGGLGLEGVEGVGMATNNSDGRHFVAVFNSSHQVLLARWITDEVFENGKDLVRNGPRRSH